MGREEERLLFPSFAFVIPTESFAEADTTSGSGEYFFIRMVFLSKSGDRSCAGGLYKVGR
jgi:hypothetical protein